MITLSYGGYVTARIGRITKAEDHPWGKKWRPSEVEPLLTPYSYPSRPLWIENDLSGALYTYKSSFYLNACLEIIMTSVGSVPIQVMQRKSKSRPWEPNQDHPLQTLLDYPNPFMTWRQLIERVAGHVVLAGNALWAKNKLGGTTLELWPLDPDLVKIKPHQTKFIESYQYGEGPKAKTLLPEDVIHFSRIDLKDLRWGTGYINVGKKLFEMDASAMDWNQTMMVQRGIYTNVIGVKHPLTTEQYNDLRTKIATRRLGGVEAGQDLIIGADVAVSRIGANAQEMEYIESRKLTRQDISALMGVPLPMIGIYEDASLANVPAARKLFWQDRIIPFLRKIEDSLNLTFFPEFGDREKNWVRFNVDDVEAVRSVKFEKTKEFQLLVQSGISPRGANQELQMGFKDEDVLPGFLVKAESDESGEAIAPVLDPNKQAALNPSVAGAAAQSSTERGKSPTPRKPADQRAKVPQRAGVKMFLDLYQKELEQVLTAAHTSLKINTVPDLSDIAVKWFDAFEEVSGLPRPLVKTFWEGEMQQKVNEYGKVKAICDTRGLNFAATMGYSYTKWAPEGASALMNRLEAFKGKHVLSDADLQ